jgi:lipoprotein-anchoring transpeptidase ErfK/SrfK
VSRDKAACPPRSTKRVPNRGARCGLGLTAAAASLGLSCISGAPAAAFPYPLEYPPYGEYSPYRAFTTEPRPAKTRDPLAATGQPPRKHSKTAEAAKPEPPKPPAGPLILAVSIGSQRVTVYDNGTPIASSPISSGKPGHLTPMGVFSVIQKEKWHRSNLYSDAPMPFMQRITWSGVAMHAGVLPGYPASHGCIRLPESFAVRLYGMTRVGARVIVTRNDAAPYEIDHPRLAGLVKKPDPAPEARTVDVTPNAYANAAGLDRSEIATGAVVVASTAASIDVANDGTGALENVHNGSENVAALATTVAPAPVERFASIDKPVGLRPTLEPPIPMPHAKPADATLRYGPISLFVSRKEGKLFVRKGFEPLFNIPITIANREVPLGTHVFTASRPTDGSAGVRWLAVSIGSDRAAPEPAPAKAKGHARDERPALPPTEALHKAAAEALDRIELPPDVIDRIMPLVTPGASLLISDQGLGEETGKETDFIVVTK